MHIPDGVMSPVVIIAGWLIAIPFIALAFKKVDLSTDPSKLPRLAVVAAGIFVAMMLNFPIAGGTSGHLLGATIAFVILGRKGAIIALTLVVSIQAIIFGDGGILALGLNLLNMPVIGVAVSELVLTTVTKGRYKGNAFPIGVFAAGWCSSFVGALAVSVQLGLSYSMTGGAYGIPAIVSFPAMLGAHSIIGIGEGLICGGVTTYLMKVAPETIYRPGHPIKISKVKERSYLPAIKAVAMMFLIFTIGLVFFYLFVADKPDALEATLGRFGVTEKTYYNAPLSYGDTYGQSLVMGIVGSLFLLLLTWAISDVIRRRKEKEANDCSTQDSNS
jgi:cobalt/nickel transport system permease protein